MNDCKGNTAATEAAVAAASTIKCTSAGCYMEREGCFVVHRKGYHDLDNNSTHEIRTHMKECE